MHTHQGNPGSVSASPEEHPISGEAGCRPAPIAPPAGGLGKYSPANDDEEANIEADTERPLPFLSLSDSLTESPLDTGLDQGLVGMSQGTDGTGQGTALLQQLDRRRDLPRRMVVHRSGGGARVTLYDAQPASNPALGSPSGSDGMVPRQRPRPEVAGGVSSDSGNGGAGLETVLTASDCSPPLVSYDNLTPSFLQHSRASQR